MNFSRFSKTYNLASHKLQVYDLNDDLYSQIICHQRLATSICIKMIR